MLRRHRHSHTSLHDVDPIVANLVAKTMDGTIEWTQSHSTLWSTSYQGRMIHVTCGVWVHLAMRLYDSAGNLIAYKVSARDAKRLARTIQDYRTRVLTAAERERTEVRECHLQALSQ